MGTNKVKLRVIAGSARGTALALPDGVRPVPSRMKQALFNILADRVDGAAVLDLFSGTGSLGIEAASRGASHAVLVENDARVTGVLERNVRNARVEDRCTVLRADAYLVRAALTGLAVPFDLVFLDPPYAQSESEDDRRRLGHALEALLRDGLIEQDATAVLHVRAGAVRPEAVPAPMDITGVRRYGSGELLMCRLRKSACNAS
jgi:16S rRNA (guanine966-N2)-methyltransferase